MKNIYKLRKLLSQNTFILDVPKTFPTALKYYLRTNKHIIKKYLKYETSKISNISEGYKNLINNSFINLKEELIYNSFRCLAFHATNLTPIELQDIRKDGLKSFNEISFYNKIDILCNYGFNKDDIKIIKTKCKIKTHYLKNTISVCYSLKDVNDGEIRQYSKSWGGWLTINNSAYDKKIREKLSTIGKPYLIITSIPIDTCFLSNFPISYFRYKKDKPHYPIDHKVIIRNNKIQVIDILPYEEDLYLKI